MTSPMAFDRQDKLKHGLMARSVSGGRANAQCLALLLLVSGLAALVPAVGSAQDVPTWRSKLLKPDDLLAKAGAPDGVRVILTLSGAAGAAPTAPLSSDTRGPGVTPPQVATTEQGRIL